MPFHVDHDQARAFFTAGPGFSGTVLSKAIAQMFETDPKTASYDFVVDVRDSDTGATQADIEIVVEAYLRQPRKGGVKYGCFVSTDPNYPLWTAAMDHLFGDRRNRVFATPESAVAFLDRMRAPQRRGAA